MKRYILTIMTFCVFSQLWAQKELSNWFFGNNDALTWNSKRSLSVKGVAGTPDAVLKGVPEEIKGSVLTTAEGCFTMSDKWGNLLFYSDGSTVWNKDNQIMVNGTGLGGSYTSAQSGIVINYPGSSTKYIAFAVDQWYRNTLNYAIIDMSLQGGLGEVTEKGTLGDKGEHQGLLGESVSAVRHSNFKDFWLVAPGKSTAPGLPTYMNVWKIDETGISFSGASAFNLDTSETSTTSPTSTQGIAINGYLTFNARGNNFVWPLAAFEVPVIEEITVFGEFNPTDGTFGTIKYFSPGMGYGAEFTLSGKYVYLPSIHDGDIRRTYYPSPTYIKIYDFEELLSASDPDAVAPYKEIITDVPAQGAAQMGMNGRIYIISNGYYNDIDAVTGNRQPNGMVIIDNPEEVDNLRIYYADNILSNPSNYTGGLPTFSKSWLYVKIEGEEQPCRGTIQTYTIDLDEFASSADFLIWDWGDGVRSAQIPVSSGSQYYSASHKYDAAGFYSISVEVYSNDDPSYPTHLYSHEVEAINCGIYVNPHLQTVIMP